MKLIGLAILPRWWRRKEGDMGNFLICFFQLTALIMTITMIHCENRSRKTGDKVDEMVVEVILTLFLIGPYGIFFVGWVIIFVLEFIFRTVRTVVGIIELIALVIWFILYITNMVRRWSEERK